MCEYFSCIITSDLKVHWLKENPADHQAIIDKLKLEDVKLENRSFVRIEIVPATTIPTRNPKDWYLKIDEPTTLPDWFIENQKKAEKQCWLAWEQSVQVNLGLDNEDKGEIKDGWLLLRGNSKVEARENSKVEAWENSKVEAWGNSKVVAWENSKVVARENSKVEAWGNSKVVAWENSKVVAWENSKVEARENSTVEAWENSKVEIKSLMAVVRSQDKIYVHTKATVVKTTKAPPDKEA